MKITIALPQAIHELGQRDNQEDSIYPVAGQATATDRIFVLCDGMGGHEHGEVASQTVAEALSRYLAAHADPQQVVTDDTLLSALADAYAELDKKDDGSARKMGTTLCLLVLHRGGATVMHIGDSRIYHIRPSEQRLLYQSKDHSLVYELYEAGEISFDEMHTSPQKNVITRAMQPGEDNRVRPSVVHMADLRAGDYLYLCSDGMLETMSNDELCRLFASGESDDGKRARLIAATAGNKDNHSAYFVRITGVEREAGDEALPDDEQTSPDNALNIVPARTAESDVEMVSQPDVINAEEVAPARRADAPGSETGREGGRNRGIVAALAAFAVVLVVALFFVAGPSRHQETAAPVQQKVIRHNRKAPPATRARKVKTNADKKPKAGEQETARTGEEETDQAPAPAQKEQAEEQKPQAEKEQNDATSPATEEQNDKASQKPTARQTNNNPLNLKYKSV